MPLSSLIFLEVSAVLCSITSKAILQDTIRCYILLCHYCTFKSPISNCPFCKLCSSLLCTSQIPCVLICVPQRSWEEGKPIIITTKLCRRTSLLNLEKKWATAAEDHTCWTEGPTSQLRPRPWVYSSHGHMDNKSWAFLKKQNTVNQLFILTFLCYKHKTLRR